MSSLSGEKFSDRRTDNTVLQGHVDLAISDECSAARDGHAPSALDQEALSRCSTLLSKA